MKRIEIITALTGYLDKTLASELVTYFIEIKQDASTSTLGRSSPGKYIETVVQCMQYLENGKWETKPNVDEYLRALENRPAIFDDGIRICMSRLARSIYCLRSKRNIIHKGMIDPNISDLKYIYSGSHWILAEFLRHSSNISMEEAGRLIAQVESPLCTIVEDFGAHRLVLANFSTREELLVLFHSIYPEQTNINFLYRSLTRKDKSTVRRALKLLWEDKFIENVSVSEYKLTQLGFTMAENFIREIK
jgi:hypothetical protein